MSINICVYCGSRIPEDKKFENLAKQIGSAIASKNWGLVYGGGKVGMMGVIADAALEKKGEVIGIIPTALKRAEVVHTGVSEIIETPDMHTRKALMEKRSSAFVVLPGGFGTLDEFFEILTWRQLGIHDKPIILVNAFGYFDGLSSFVDTAIDHDFVRANNRELFSITSNLEETISVLEQKL
jgi:hypothetical protein